MMDFGMSNGGGFQGMKPQGQNPISPIGAPRTSIPPQFSGSGQMQPSSQIGGNAMQGQPGNSLFGHSQGLGMGQGNTGIVPQGMPPQGMPPQNGIASQGNPFGGNKGMVGQGIPPEILQQLLQMFGSNQQFQELPGRMYARQG